MTGHLTGEDGVRQQMLVRLIPVIGHLHLMYGLAGSGKSTLARRLADRTPAVRFTLDEWMLRLYPELGIADARYGPPAAEVRELIWSVAAQVLRTGIDVVLDWSCWSIARRTWATQRARAVGADVILHHLTTPLEESVRRAEQRDAAGEVYSHRIIRADNEHLAGLLEEPSTAGGIQIVEH